MKSSGFSHFPGAYRVPQKIDSKDRKPKHRNPLHSKENIFDLFKMLSAAFRHRHRREHQLSAAARHIVVDQGIIIQPAKLCGHAGALRNVQIVNNSGRNHTVKLTAKQIITTVPASPKSIFLIISPHFGIVVSCPI